MTKRLTITALQRAFNQQPPQEGLIHHSDRGSQYATTDYQAILGKYNITTSMSRKGNCYDNACIESFLSEMQISFCHRKIALSIIKIVTSTSATIDHLQ